MSRLLAILLVVGLSACATAPRSFEDRLQSRYLYRPVSRMNADLGAPRLTTKIEGGGSSYEWMLAEGKAPGSPGSCHVVATTSASDVVQNIAVDKATAGSDPKYCDEFATATLR
jgi:hypothetical protein